MAIHRHVRDKDQLLDLMADRVLSELDVAAATAPTWQDQAWTLRWRPSAHDRVSLPLLDTQADR